MLAVSCSRNVICSSVKALTEASSITALTWPSNSTGSTMMFRGGTLNSPEPIGTTLGGMSVMSSASLVGGALADQALADRRCAA